jgi:hypothetical protein
LRSESDVAESVQAQYRTRAGYHYGENVMQNNEAYRKAKKKLKAKRDFYMHLFAYIGVNILLVIINLLTSPQYIWFKWPLVGWGIGLLIHALGVFVFPRRLAITEQMIEKEMNKEDLDKK